MRRTSKGWICVVLRAAVVGLGNIGVEHVRALSRTPEARLVAVCDRSPAAARAVAERYSVADAFHDVEQMLNQARPDVVHVATPPSSHVPLALQCLRGAAHVLIEKPLATSPADVELVLAEAESRGLYVLENYNYLFNRQLVQLLAWARDGRLGDVVHVDVEVALDVLGPDSPFVSGHGSPFALGLPGGLVGDFLPHLASIAHALLGPHKQAFGVWSKRSESLLPADEYRALVSHEGGTSSLGFSSHARPAGFRVTVIGSRCRARAELYSTLLAVESDRQAPSPLVPVLNGMSSARSELRGALGGLRRKLDGGPAALEGLWGLVEQLYADLVRGSEPAISHRDVRAVNRLSDDLSKSAP